MTPREARCRSPSTLCCQCFSGQRGTPLFTGLFLASKLNYCTALAIRDLNRPDSCSHCPVILCVASFVPPSTSTNKFWFSLLQPERRSSTAFFSFFFPLCYFYPVSSKFSWDCIKAKGCKEHVAPLSPSQDRFNLTGSFPLHFQKYSNLWQFFSCCYSY